MYTALGFQHSKVSILRAVDLHAIFVCRDCIGRFVAHLSSQNESVESKMNPNLDRQYVEQNMCVYIYIHTYIHIYIYVCIGRESFSCTNIICFMMLYDCCT